MPNERERQGGSVQVDVWCQGASPQEMRRTRGRPKAPLILTAEERVALEELVRNGVAEPAMAQRARIVLTCATGVPNVAVAALLNEPSHAVDRWRLRFVQHRINGLSCRPRAVTTTSEAVSKFEASVAQAVRQIPLGDVSLRGAVVRVTVRLP